MTGVAEHADVAVLGASGFAGALAARLIDRHPFFRLDAVTSRSDAGRRLDDLYPHHRVDMVLDAYDADELGAIDAAIVAYPHGASAPVVAELHERGVKVIDLSADFRLRDVAVYQAHYVEHPNPELIGEAVYGLPELYREEIAQASIVACPGCFPTAAILALKPIAADHVVIDAKTGISGAGRKATETTHFVSADENVKAYGVGTHRHVPEMEQELGVPVTFVPHLVPVDQGELLTCYLETGDDVAAQLREAYADEPFIELVDRPPGMRDVRETNFCRIYAWQDGRRAIVFAAIDNLWKGTASQAVQCLNLMFDRPETEGLL
jgi:N-acetyl-gamma-glutamyl-phosphate reductase